MPTTYQIVLTVREHVAGDVYRLAENVDTERIAIRFAECRAELEIVEVVSTQVKGY